MTAKYPKASKKLVIGSPSCKTESAPNWGEQLKSRWTRTRQKTLSTAVSLLATHHLATSEQSNALPDQPFDRHLLSLSPLYQLSRKLFTQQGGHYSACLNSSPRTLSSPILLEPRIEFSPVEQEYIWAATDPIQKKDEHHLMLIRSFISNPFHEQNHRNLWKILPNAPQKRDSMRRYLNFAESLVIVLDMALSDQLGPELSSLFHLAGVIYDRGVDHSPLDHLNSRDQKNQRVYRNYLQACTYATYLYLEGYEPYQITQATQALFNHPIPVGKAAAERSLRLDLEFVRKTNPFWQNKNWKVASQRLQRESMSALEIPDDPTQNHQIYFWCEKWLTLNEI